MRKTKVTHFANTHNAHQYKYFLLLASLYITITLTATALTYRLVSIGPFTLHGGSVIFPFSYILGDIITEVYGYRLSRQLIWISIICGFAFSLMVTIVIYLPAPNFWHDQQTYLYVFGNSLRFTIGASAAGFIGSFINIYSISKSKIYLHGKYFWLRSFFSSTFGEAIQSLIGISIGFIGIVPISNVVGIMTTSFMMKIIYSIAAVGPANYVAIYLKQKEGVDIYDYETKFTPFSF